MNLSLKEVGRLTMKQFLSMYQAYKDTFDVELILTLSRTTYKELKAKSDAAEEW